jgi:bacteriorhodopsin
VESDVVLLLSAFLALVVGVFAYIMSRRQKWGWVLFGLIAFVAVFTVNQ